MIGCGGREHALGWKLARARASASLLRARERRDGAVAACVPVAADGPRGLLAFAEEQAIDLTVVGPEAPLSAGIADLFEERPALFGPSRAAAELEGSKTFAKEFMRRHGIPTAASRSSPTPPRPRLHRTAGRRSWSRPTAWPPARA